MAKQWDAEIELSAEHAKAAIESSLPDFSVNKIEVFGEGWDNFAFKVNSRYCTSSKKSGLRGV